MRCLCLRIYHLPVVVPIDFFDKQSYLADGKKREGDLHASLGIPLSLTVRTRFLIRFLMGESFDEIPLRMVLHTTHMLDVKMVRYSTTGSVLRVQYVQGWLDDITDNGTVVQYCITFFL